jgi:hypothetical protein
MIFRTFFKPVTRIPVFAVSFYMEKILSPPEGQSSIHLIEQEC